MVVWLAGYLLALRYFIPRLRDISMEQAEARSAVTGRVFEAEGGRISIADGWRSTEGVDKGARWEASEIGSAVDELLAKEVPAQKVYGT